MSHWTDRYILAHSGISGIVRACRAPGCHFRLFTRRPPRPGRGWGFREGNKQRGAMIQHIKNAHADLQP